MDIIKPIRATIALPAKYVQDLLHLKMQGVLTETIVQTVLPASILIMSRATESLTAEE